MEDVVAQLEATKAELIKNGWTSLNLGCGDRPKCLLGAAAQVEGLDLASIYAQDTPLLRALRDQAAGLPWYQDEYDDYPVRADGAYVNAPVYRVNDGMLRGLNDAVAFIDDTIIAEKEKSQ